MLGVFPDIYNKFCDLKMDNLKEKRSFEPWIRTHHKQWRPHRCTWTNCACVCVRACVRLCVSKRVGQLRRLPDCSHFTGCSHTGSCHNWSAADPKSHRRALKHNIYQFWLVSEGTRNSGASSLNANFLPQKQVAAKLTFPFKSRINIADADILVGNDPGEKAWMLSKFTVEYGSVEGGTLRSHHIASSSPLLFASNYNSLLFRMTVQS